MHELQKNLHVPGIHGISMQVWVANANPDADDEPFAALSSTCDSNAC
jgi:hypothetical protein